MADALAPTRHRSAQWRGLRPWVAIVVLAALCAGCASVPSVPNAPHAAKTETLALPHPEATRLGAQFAEASRQHADTSAFHIITAGVDGFVTRVQMVRAAERTLDLQYFIFRGDETGSMLTDELKAAAQRGVRVRVLVDDGDTVEGDQQILAIDGLPNVEVRVFNPFDYRGHNHFRRNLDFVLHKSRLDYRMHNKLLIVDNAVALVGGRNVGNQYFQIDPESQFADDDAFSAGPIVQDLSKTFDEFWNSDMAIPAGWLKPSHRRGKSPSQQRLVKASGIDYPSHIASGEPYTGMISGRTPLTWAHGTVLCDSPHKGHGADMAAAVAREIGAVKTELLMVTPYFVPSQTEYGLLKDLRARDTTVQILSNSLESAPQLSAQSGYMKYRVPLLQAGVGLYEVRARLSSVRGSGQTRKVSQYGNYSLHGKMYVFDRERLFIGSMNYDQRSWRINTEIGVMIESPDIARQTAQRFAAMVGPQEAYTLTLRGTHIVWETEIDHVHVELTKEPSRGWWQRQKVLLLSMLPLAPEL
jgi:putative cardiolipin synthase